MNSQHRYPTRHFRPDPAGEYEPARRVVEAAGWRMAVVLRAFLRRLAEDPDTVLAELRPHLQAVADSTPKGRPPAKT